MKMISNEEFELLSQNDRYEYLAQLGERYIDSEFTDIKAFNQLFLLTSPLRKSVARKFYMSFKLTYDYHESLALVDSCFLEVVRLYDKSKDKRENGKSSFVTFIKTRLFFKVVDLARVEYRTRRASNQNVYLVHFDPRSLEDPDVDQYKTYSSMKAIKLSYMINQALQDERYNVENYLASEKESDFSIVIKPYIRKYIEYLKEKKAGERIRIAEIFLEELHTFKGPKRVRKEFSNRSEEEIQKLVNNHSMLKTLIIEKYYHEIMTAHYPQELEEHYKLYLKLKPFSIAYNKKEFRNLLYEHNITPTLYRTIERSYRKTQRKMRQILKEGEVKI